MNDYKVVFFQNDTWEVLKINDFDCESVFQGSLADCEAWIRLKQFGYLD